MPDNRLLSLVSCVFESTASERLLCCTLYVWSNVDNIAILAYKAPCLTLGTPPPPTKWSQRQNAPVGSPVQRGPAKSGIKTMLKDQNLADDQNIEAPSSYIVAEKKSFLQPECLCKLVMKIPSYTFIMAWYIRWNIKVRKQMCSHSQPIINQGKQKIRQILQDVILFLQQRNRSGNNSQQMMCVLIHDHLGAGTGDWESVR